MERTDEEGEKGVYKASIINHEMRKQIKPIDGDWWAFLFTCNRFSSKDILMASSSS